MRARWTTMLVLAGTLAVAASAQAGGWATVELSSTPQGLQWRCSCSRRVNRFCKHCVAVAVATWEEPPPLGQRSDVGTPDTSLP